MLKTAGLRNIQGNSELPWFNSGSGKQMAILTLCAIESNLLRLGLVSIEEIEKIKNNLDQFTARPQVAMSLPRIHRVHGAAATA